MVTRYNPRPSNASGGSPACSIMESALPRSRLRRPPSLAAQDLSHGGARDTTAVGGVAALGGHRHDLVSHLHLALRPSVAERITETAGGQFAPDIVVLSAHVHPLWPTVVCCGGSDLCCGGSDLCCGGSDLCCGISYLSPYLVYPYPYLKGGETTGAGRWDARPVVSFPSNQSGPPACSPPSPSLGRYFRPCSSSMMRISPASASRRAAFRAPRNCSSNRPVGSGP